VGYTNWLPGEPNNSWPPDGEDFCAMYTHPVYAREWNDVPVIDPQYLESRQFFSTA
jgi:hypothetical protein